jgi:UDP-N-acetylmuramoylalanine--D-glutamate ligase
LVRELHGARWYDDSIATAPERALAAMRSFDEPIVLLAGGRDKELPWQGFVDETLERVRRLITFGEAGPMIAESVSEAMGQKERGKALEGISRVRTLEDAVAEAARVAEPGDVVLLSPGGTSYDAFEDFVERGNLFKELVEAL